MKTKYMICIVDIKETNMNLEQNFLLADDIL